MNTKASRIAYWQEHLKAFDKSGLSQREYCRQADIGYGSFNQWKRRIENNQAEEQPIIEVSHKPVIQEPMSDNVIVIRWNNSLQISLPPKISPEILTIILNSVGEYTCR